jgi:alpha-tubulin suppressor-like RCC1 family protein
VPSILTNAVAIGSHYIPSFAIRFDGEVTPWGGAVFSLPTNIFSIAFGENHGVALRIDGTLTGWGNNDYGQLNFPPGATGIVAVAAGGNLSLALHANGTLVLWGSSSLFLSSNVSNVVSIAAGGSHVLVACSNGTVVQGTFQNPSQALQLSNVVAVAAGVEHSLALHSNGTVTAWGRNAELQCSVPPGLSNVVAIAAGGNHSLALKTDGSVVAWGDSSNGLNSPPSDLTNVIAIACGYVHSVVLQAGPRFIITPSNVVSSFGGNVVLTAKAEASTPIQFQWLRNGIALLDATNSNLTISNAQPENAGVYALLASADGFTNVTSVRVAFGPPPIVLSATTNVWVFDDESAAFQITAEGPGPLQYQWLREGVEIPDATNNTLIFTSPISAKAGAYSLRITTAWANQITVPAYLHVLLSRRFGNVVTWGYQNQVPEGVADIVAIAAGTHHTVGLKVDGTVVAWGDNAYGQTNVPPGLREVVAISTGGRHSFAIRRDGTAVAWGHNANGQATLPAGLEKVAAIASADAANVALLPDSTVVSWGNLADALAPIPPNATNIISIVGGSYVTAKRRDGSIITWGAGISEADKVTLNSITGAKAIFGSSASGANSAIMRSNAPTFFHGIDPGPSAAMEHLAAVAFGYLHGVAFNEDGDVVSWGWNDYGQTNTPAGLSNVIGVAAGEVHSAAIVERNCFIAPQVENRSTYLGSNVAVSVIVKSAYPLAFQWLFNGMPVNGATNKILNISGAQFSDNGAYVLVASNHFGATMSPPVTLTVLQPLPAITSQPTNLSVATGSNATFAVSAVGLPELSYQWSYNGDDLTGATNSTLIISNVTEAQAGVYAVRVMNSVGVAASSNVVLTLQPVNVIIDNSQTTSSGPWFENFGSGQYGNSFLYNPFGSGAYFVRFTTVLPRAGNYRVYEWHPFGPSSFSSALPHYVTHEAGTNLITVNQTINPGRWNLLGTFRFTPGIPASVRITAAVSESGRSAAADAIRFEYVAAPPQVTMQPIDQFVVLGTNANFSVSITSAAPARIQWRKDGTNLPGGTNLTFQIANTQLADEGAYSVLVTSADGVTFSASALLRVVLPPLSHRGIDGGFVLEWIGSNILQSSTNVAGPYFDFPAGSPYTNLFDGPQKFFRLRQ